MPIHPTAIVDRSAEIDPSAEIGAYAIVERGVTISAGVRIYAHAYISEGTTLGQRVQVHQFAVIGHFPQDLKFKGEPTYTRIGDDTIIREHAQVHRGTMPGSTTIVGRNCFLMASSHIGHNCLLADNVIVVTFTALAGHVEVGERAFIGGGSVVHQFCRVGKLAMIGGGVALPNDALPFMTIRTLMQVVGPNVVGMRRAGYTAEERQEVRECYRILFRSSLQYPEALALMRDRVRTRTGRELLEFASQPSLRGIRMERRASRRPTVTVDEEESAEQSAPPGTVL